MFGKLTKRLRPFLCFIKHKTTLFTFGHVFSLFLFDFEHTSESNNSRQAVELIHEEDF